MVLRRPPGEDFRVLKFGGAALRDGAGVGRACRIVAEHGGGRPIVVVSAHQGVTRQLDRLAHAAADRAGHLPEPGSFAPGGLGEDVRVRHRSLLHQLALDSELLDRHLRQLTGLLREVHRTGALAPEVRDHVLSFGERMSARVVAAALRQAGVGATPVDAFDLGLVTDGHRDRARPFELVHLAGDRVRAVLDSVPGVPVVTGFLAADARGNVTTLGPNGSDLTAALLAEAVEAREVHLWKTVDGVMTADPDLVPSARAIERLGYAEAAELAWHGAAVLHPAAVERAVRSGVALRVRNANAPDAPGTLIERVTTSEGPVGIAHRTDVVQLRLSVEPGPQRAQLFAALTGRLAEFGLVPLLLASDARGTSVIVEEDAGLLKQLAAAGGEVEVDRNVGLVAIVGRGVHRAEVGMAAASALNSRDLRPRLVGGREQGLSRLLSFETSEVAEAVRALHDSLL